jgi:HicA toxin of bacterial toxin-antitoxin,
VNRKQTETLKAIFKDPVRADIAWRDFESLLNALGAKVTKGKGSVRRVLLNDEVGILREPHPQKVLKKWAVRYARDFLTNANISSGH